MAACTNSLISPCIRSFRVKTMVSIRINLSVSGLKRTWVLETYGGLRYQRYSKLVGCQVDPLNDGPCLIQIPGIDADTVEILRDLPERGGMYGVRHQVDPFVDQITN